MNHEKMASHSFHSCTDPAVFLVKCVEVGAGWRKCCKGCESRVCFSAWPQLCVKLPCVATASSMAEDLFS